MKITQFAAIQADAVRVLKSKDRYVAVSRKTGVPIVLLMALNEREDGGRFDCYLGNGEPLNRVTRLVPQGRGPFSSWDAGAVDALTFEHLCGISDWTWALVAYHAEAWNGWGYRMHGVHSAYLWAGSNVYTGGKYISDGHFDATAMDSQIGVIPLMRAIVALDPSLGLPGWPEDEIPVPQPVPDEISKAIAPKPLALFTAAPQPSSLILDRDIAELCQGAYAYPGDDPVTWDYVDDGAGTGVKLMVKEVNGISVLIFPGTENIQDCIRDLEAVAETPLDDPAFGPVHWGGHQGVAVAIKRLNNVFGPRFIVAGHSLGAMRADNAVGYLIQAGTPPLARVVFGEPRPGFQKFADYIASVPARAYRNEAGIVGDPVTAVPFKLSNMPYVHPSKQIGFTSDPSWNDLWGPVAPHRIQYYVDGLKGVATGTQL